ncbi:MAG: leucine-rich repeat domain-containing protein, partial [Muribaculaceae bacterium]|nr:leucine-rich repeat domain-containing protein [Muribaculaceae bacterium]
MKKHILATAALASFAIAANAEALTVHHRTQGQLAAEITAALTEAGLQASQVTELTVISDVVNEKQVPQNVYSWVAGGAEDCAAIRSNFRPSLKKVDFSQAVFYENTTGVPQNDDLFLVNMTSLEEVILPETVTTLGGGSFKNCSKLVKVNLPAGLKNIGKRAFLNCKSIKLAELPDQIRYIGDEAFNDGNSAATWIAFTKMPSCIETIEGNAFNNTSVSFSELPEGLKKIGDKAFRNTKVTFTKAPSTLETMGNAAFVNAPITEFTIDGCLETN